MGVTKFRTFEDAEQALWNVAPDTDYYKRVRAMFEFAEKLRPHNFQPGITKYRSIEDKNRADSLLNSSI